MIRRTMNPEALNALANHPDIRPFIGGPEGELDLTSVVLNPANVVLMGEGVIWVLSPIEAGVFELHSMAYPDARGRAYFRQAKEALRWVFTRTDCSEIVTKCPDDNPRARMAAVMTGFRERFHRENAWAEGVGVGFYVYGLDEWFVRDPECLKAGRWFHEKIEAAIGHENHAPDETHDRAAGAAVLMMREGQIGKGCAFYSRWGRFAGYQPIAQIGPHLVDIGTAIVEIQGQDFEVLHLR